MEGGYGERGRKRCRKNDIAQGGNEVENEREMRGNEREMRGNEVVIMVGGVFQIINI